MLFDKNYFCWQSVSPTYTECIPSNQIECDHNVKQRALLLVGWSYSGGQASLSLPFVLAMEVTAQVRTPSHLGGNADSYPQIEYRESCCSPIFHLVL